jgi:hypothetical protein
VKRTPHGYGQTFKLPAHADDFYPTPRRAVLPLIPHLRLHGVRSFAEPCCGDGALVNHLESFGLRCAYAGDIASGHDALTLASYGEVDAIITNPPHKRPVMHALIDHFQRIAPTWLLIDLDWAGTKQAIPYLARCSDIAPLGRLCLFPATKTAGKENFGWFRFDAHHAAGPVFHPYRSPPCGTRSCAQCREPYRPHRSDSRFCSNACRQRAYRERLGVTQV